MVQPTLSLLNGSLRLALTVDSQWGLRKFNNTLRQQCQSGVCRGLFDPTAPLDLQAATVALGSFSQAGFHENGAFTRLREVSLSYEVPRHLARRVGADRWLLALTGRNLGVRTDYSGVDPEVQSGSGDSRGNEDFFSVPLMQRFSFRSSFRF